MNKELKMGEMIFQFYCEKKPEFKFAIPHRCQIGCISFLHEERMCPHLKVSLGGDLSEQTANPEIPNPTPSLKKDHGDE